MALPQEKTPERFASVPAGELAPAAVLPAQLTPAFRHDASRQPEKRLMLAVLEEAVAAYAKQMRINYPLLVGDEAGLSLMTRYGNSRGALPYTVVLGPDGSILAKKLGAYKKDELEKLASMLVKPPSATNMPR